MPVVPIINTVMIDCSDSASLAEFWKELLDVDIRMAAHGFVWLDPQREGGFSVAFQEVDHPTPGKNKIHLDAYHTDIPAMTERVIELGGSVVGDQEGEGFEWTVFADIEGNQFCVGHPSDQ